MLLMEWVMIGILVCLIAWLMFIIGYYMGHGLSNNHKELLQSFVSENNKLEFEKRYYEQLYKSLYASIDSDCIEDTVCNCKGEVCSVILKK